MRRGARRRTAVRAGRRARGRASGAMAAAVGAAHRLPALLASGSCGATRCARCASSARTGRRKSEVRSALRAPPPRLRCSAPPKSPRLRARAHAARRVRRYAAERRSGNVGGVRTEDEAFPGEYHDGIGKGAGRAPRARLVRSREAQQHRRRAQRASSIILAATVRAELAQRAQRVSPRQPVLRASQGTPAKRGQAPGAPATPGPRLCARRRPRFCARQRPRLCARGHQVCHRCPAGR